METSASFEARSAPSSYSTEWLRQNFEYEYEHAHEHDKDFKSSWLVLV